MAYWESRKTNLIAQEANILQLQPLLSVDKCKVYFLLDVAPAKFGVVDHLFTLKVAIKNEGKSTASLTKAEFGKCSLGYSRNGGKGKNVPITFQSGKREFVPISPDKTQKYKFSFSARDSHGLTDSLNIHAYDFVFFVHFDDVFTKISGKSRCIKVTAKKGMDIRTKKIVTTVNYEEIDPEPKA